MSIFQAIGDLATGIDNRRAAAREARKNRAFQKEAWVRDDARIQRTVADAKTAGIHPLFALGGATGGGGSSAPLQATQQTGSALGDAFKALSAYQKDKATKARGTQSGLVDNALIDQATANAGLARARQETVEWMLQNSIEKRAEAQVNLSQDTPIMGPEPVMPLIDESKFVGPPRPRTSQQEWGGQKKIDPRVNTAQQNEDIHGEIMGNLYTMANEAVRWKRRVSKETWANIRKFVLPNVSVRKRNLLHKYAKPANFGASP